MLNLWNPATGVRAGQVPVDDDASIAEKLARAKEAQPAWAARPFAERAACLRRFQEAIRAERETLARTLTLDTGKPITQARGEVAAVGGRIAWFLEHTEALLAPRTIRTAGPGQTGEEIRYPPLGVVVNISAWNYPWFVGANVFCPALLSGNAVLYKPSEHATRTGLALARLLHAAGVPKAIFPAVIGAGKVGAALLRPGIDGVFFTGSHRVGLRIAAAAAPLLVPVQLELGGKDPLYVADDIDPVWAAAQAAEGAMYNAGQSCCAIERIYVHEAVAEPFERALVERVQAYRVGDPGDPATQIGPLCREPQRAVLETQIERARAAGGEVATGGGPLARPGFFFAPTVVLRADDRCSLMREESFGPVIGVRRVTGDDEAIRRMDDTPYGLTAAVFAREQARAERILSALQTGSAYWNCCDRVSPELPWSGRRGSGLGVTLSAHGVYAFCRPRGWHLRQAPARMGTEVETADQPNAGGGTKAGPGAEGKAGTGAEAGGGARTGTGAGAGAGAETGKSAPGSIAEPTP